MDYNEDKLKNVKKIAVLRANALGDFIVTLPALNALKNTYPHAELVLLGKSWHKEFLTKGRTPVDRVIVVPVKQGIHNDVNKVEDAEEILSFTKQMQDEQFDVAINFHGSGIAANPFIKTFNAKLTAGFWRKDAEKLDINLDYYYYQSEALRYLELVRLVGAQTSDIEPKINVLNKDEQEVNNFLSQLQKPYIVLHPIAMDVRRMWPIENYARLADILRQKNVEVIFTGSAEDKKVVDDIIYDMRYTAINACGNFSLGALAAVLSKASLVIGADTGPMHLARAVNAPTIGFYWAPNLINWGPLLRGNHRPLISWQMSCPLCGIVPNDPYPFEPRTNCDHPISFVRDITIEQVVEAADSLLKNKELLTTPKASVCLKA